MHTIVTNVCLYYRMESETGNLIVVRLAKALYVSGGGALMPYSRADHYGPLLHFKMRISNKYRILV